MSAATFHTYDAGIKELRLPRWGYQGSYLGYDLYKVNGISNSSSRSTSEVESVEVSKWGKEGTEIVPLGEFILGYYEKLPENKYLGTICRAVRLKFVGEQRPTAWAFEYGGSFTPDGKRGALYVGGASGALFQINLEHKQFFPAS